MTGLKSSQKEHTFEKRGKFMWMEKRKRKNGTRYLFAERYIDPLTGKNQKVSVTLTSNSNRAQKEASMLLNKMIEERLNKTKTNKTKLTFSELYDEFFKLKKKTVRPSSLRVYNAIGKILKKYFKDDYLIENINTRIMQDFFNSLDYSNEYLKSIKALVSEMFSYAVELQYIDRSPVQFARIPYKSKTIHDIQKTQNKYLEKDEVENLLTHLNRFKRTRPTARLAEFLYLTGMRIGEATALKKEDIDFENKVVHITGSIDISKGYKLAEKGLAKTDTSFRDIYLTDRAIKLLKTCLAENKIAMKSTETYNDRGFIFTTWSGTPIQVNSFNRTLKHAAPLVGISSDKTVTSHIFRHTHISILAENNIPLQAIMQRVGHKNSDITQEIYTHVTKKMNKQVLASLESLGL